MAPWHATTKHCMDEVGSRSGIDIVHDLECADWSNDWSGELEVCDQVIRLWPVVQRLL